MLSRAIRTTRTLGAAVLIAAGLGACGGDPPSDAVVQVGGNAITKAAVSHWMSTLVSGDSYEISGLTAPRGLVSEPPRYAACVADLEALAGRPTAGRTAPKVPLLEEKCRVLHQAMKEQTASYLIAFQVLIGEDAELGVRVSEREVEQEVKRYNHDQFPKQGELQRYLAQRGWSRSDEAYIVKKDMLSERFVHELHRKFSSERRLEEYGEAETKKWRAKTSCRSGYVVEQCKEYRSAGHASVPAPAELVKEIAALRAPSTTPPARDLNCKNKGAGLSCQPVR